MCFRPASIISEPIECPKCGTLNPPTATVCDKCGYRGDDMGGAAPTRDGSGAPGGALGAPGAPGAPKAPGAPGAPGAPRPGAPGVGLPKMPPKLPTIPKNE